MHSGQSQGLFRREVNNHFSVTLLRKCNGHCRNPERILNDGTPLEKSLDRVLRHVPRIEADRIRTDTYILNQRGSECLCQVFMRGFWLRHTAPYHADGARASNAREPSLLHETGETEARLRRLYGSVYTHRIGKGRVS